MGLEPKELEVALHAAFGDPALARRLAHTPVCRAVAGLALQGFTNQPCDLLILDRTGTPGSQLIVQSPDAIAHKTPTPLAHGRIRQCQALRHRMVGLSACAPQYDLRP